MTNTGVLKTVRPVVSLSGATLTPPPMNPATRERLEANLAQVKTAYEANPDDPENIIWVGRRTAYLSGYHEAIDIYTEGLKKFPDHYKLLRHRGHRYISVRQFDRAIADLERAARLIEGVQDQVEPDGAPNRYNIPTSSNHFNIWYHLGLAYYLKGDFENALRCFTENKKFVYNFDALVANSDWLYMIYRRLGREQEAKTLLEPIRNDLSIIENDAYFKRLRMYKGEIAPADLLGTGGGDLDRELALATQGYGVANWYLYNGQIEKAKEMFTQIIKSPSWAAFGYIAAEAELNRTAK
ncbi:MAG: hypothetical protein FJY97_10980 [candidate division Zixibacteria bacterium]|nr:hypothetical protein [candidate division Zixibacteria bacterium]